MKRERGVALITALLVVALATTAAVAMVSRQQIDIRRAGNVLEAEQAYLYLAALEDWAGQVLRRDRREGEVDHLQENWAIALPPIPVEGGQVAGRLEDAQGRLNLNNLVAADGKQDPLAVRRLQRLLTVLGLNPELALAVADWIDPDLESSGAYGAEDDVYLGRTPAYRAANRPMAAVSELRLVAGFMEPAPEQPEEATQVRTVYDVVAPFLAALPQRTAINVNTASAPVLATLADGLTLADGETLAAARGDKGFESVQVLLQHPLFAGRAVSDARLAVASEHFLLYSAVTVGRSELRMGSLLRRRVDGGASETVWRAQSVM